MKALILSLLTAVAALVAATAAAAGGTYTCTGAIGEGPGFAQFIPSTIDGNVDVPAGASCTMFLVTVTGNVTVEGSLGGFGNTFEKNVIVNRGSVDFPTCFSPVCAPLGANHIAGNLVIRNSDTGFNEVARTVVGNNLIYGNNASPLTFELATVHGNLLADSNSGEIIVFDAFVDGNATFVANTEGVLVGQTAIDGTLNCEANDPPPVTFGDSAAAAHGQCSGLSDE